ncbi:hypothetical protein [Amphibacillus jilinensis]|uniref:hypothetical protein n=1 Tax=Amphibacillus jilinensis TaxID=1216008 RepID=UPI0002E22208|nr:hypothetical protein [Amphibacillus jilinensis]
MSNKKTIGVIIGLLVFAVLLILTIPLLLRDSQQGHDDQQPDRNEQEVIGDQPNSVIESLSDDQANQIIIDYRSAYEEIINDQDDSQYLTTFESLDDIDRHLTTIMTDQHAQSVKDMYVQEHDDGIYLVPMDGVVLIDPEENYAIEEISENHYTITQQKTNEIVGHVELIYHVEWVEEQWLVADVQQHEIEPPSVEETADQVIQAIADNDYQQLAAFADEDQGVLFSPYVNVSDQDLIFDQYEIAQFAQDEHTYTWGQHDGSGEPIELTATEYTEAFVDVSRLIEPDEIFINHYNQHGNVLNNLEEAFPEATVVEYHHQGSEEEGSIDWESLHLVFEENEFGLWRLVAIISDQWTI